MNAGASKFGSMSLEHLEKMQSQQKPLDRAGRQQDVTFATALQAQQIDAARHASRATAASHIKPMRLRPHKRRNADNENPEAPELVDPTVVDGNIAETSLGQRGHFSAEQLFHTQSAVFLGGLTHVPGSNKDDEEEE